MRVQSKKEKSVLDNKIGLLKLDKVTQERWLDFKIKIIKNV